jgi:hypothetical protein
MIKKILCPLLIITIVISSCNESGQQQASDSVDLGSYPKGSFGYDLNYLQKQDDSLIVLANDSEKSQVIVSSKYQAKVFTSTADGNDGLSFGWVNYKAFTGAPDAHMNAYGGENRIWLGPKGGKFSLFFKPDSQMVFENWKTPAAYDTEPWIISNKTGQSVTMKKDMHLLNYKGTEIDALVERSVTILNNEDIEKKAGLTLDTSVKVVAYQTNNTITNEGKYAWNETTGMPCIWMLDMFSPSPTTVIIVPFKKSAEPFDKIATTNYFGEISPDRLKHTDDMLFFKADGKSRGKLGIKPDYAKPLAGSYDHEHKTLTVIMFDLDSSAKYLNQEWNTNKPSFSGDAVNAYNDGPLADGTQMGPFYEIESVSPAAFLKPGQSLSHQHTVFHFTGNTEKLDTIAQKLFGVSLKEIQKQF